HRFPGTRRDERGQAGMRISTLVYRKGRAGTTRDGRGRVHHGSGPQGRGFDSLQAHHFSKFGTGRQSPVYRAPDPSGVTTGSRIPASAPSTMAPARPAAASRSRGRTAPMWSGLIRGQDAPIPTLRPDHPPAATSHEFGA